MGAKSRSWLTSVEPADPGDWTEPAKEMGPGSRAGRKVSRQDRSIQTAVRDQLERRRIEAGDSEGNWIHGPQFDKAVVHSWLWGGLGSTPRLPEDPGGRL